MVWLALLQTLNSVGVLDDLDGVALHLAVGHELELGFVAKFAEGLAPIDDGVDGLDVGNAEIFGGFCAFGREFNAERTQSPNTTLLPARSCSRRQATASVRMPLTVPLEKGELWSEMCLQKSSKSSLS